jgi:hypothetical protein
VLPRFLTGSVEEDDDMTREQARQLEAVYKALIVPGTISPEQTVNLMFERIRAIEDALIVPGDDHRRGGVQHPVRPGAADREHARGPDGRAPADRGDRETE